MEITAICKKAGTATKLRNLVTRQDLLAKKKVITVFLNNQEEWCFIKGIIK